MRAVGFGDVGNHLREGFAAAAIVDDQIASIAQASGVTEQYADIGIFTLEPYRRKGYAAACVSLVAREAQKRGLTPVWSTGADNAGSLATAKRVGYEEAEQATYVILRRVRGF